MPTRIALVLILRKCLINIFHFIELLLKIDKNTKELTLKTVQIAFFDLFSFQKIPIVELLMTRSQLKLYH